jgi:hypothetical protein
VHGSRFQILDPPPAGHDPARQIRQPLAKIRRQLAMFFVLGPQRIGSFYVGPDPKNLKK